MCGRYTLTTTVGLTKRLGIKNAPDIQPNFNVAPGQTMPVVTGGEELQMPLMRWGLVPSWAKDEKIGYKMVNARAEGIQDKNAYRVALSKRRCLVPVTGFYEWKEEAGTRQPYFIHIAGTEVFSLAGLYEYWTKPNGETLWTYTIITTEPNSLLAGIHDRMPVILPATYEHEWLDQAVTDPEQVTRLLTSYPGKDMEAYKVSTDVNVAVSQGPTLIEPINSL